MSEKRFDYTLYDDGTSCIYDKEKDKYYFDSSIDELEKLLNDFVKENEQLRQKASSWKITASQEGNEKLKLIKRIVTLKEENENIISKNCTGCELVNLQTKKIDVLEKENEELRKEKMDTNAFIVEKGLELEFIKWCKK